MVSALNFHCLNVRVDQYKELKQRRGSWSKGRAVQNFSYLKLPSSRLLSSKSRSVLAFIRRPEPPDDQAKAGKNAGFPFQSDNIVDRVSGYICRKLRDLLRPYVPEEFDLFSWLPVEVHSRIHKSEYIATLVVREALIVGFSYLLFSRVDTFCRWLHELYIKYAVNNERGDPQEGQHTPHEYEASSFCAVRGPFQFVIFLWAATRLVKSHIVGRVRAIGLIFAIIWYLMRWKRLFIEHLASKSRIDAPRVSAIDKVASLFLYFLAASSIAEVCGFALSSLLAVGGISGLAVGLAAKEIVSNVFGGAILFMTRPFVIGERIKAASFSGDVLDIGFLQTKLLGFDKVPVLVPNQAFINQVIINYSRAKDKLLDATFQIRHQDIFVVERITDRVVQYLRWHKEVDKGSQPPICYLKTMGPAGVDVSVVCIVRAPMGPNFYRIQQEILLQVARIISEEGACLGTSAPFTPVVLPNEEIPGEPG